MRPAMAAPIVSDDPEAFLENEHHLRIPIVGRQRPAMVEEQRPAGPPVFVEQLRAVLRRERRHRASFVRC